MFFYKTDAHSFGIWKCTEMDSGVRKAFHGRNEPGQINEKPKILPFKTQHTFPDKTDLNPCPEIFHGYFHRCRMIQNVYKN